MHRGRGISHIAFVAVILTIAAILVVAFPPLLIVAVIVGLIFLPVAGIPFVAGFVHTWTESHARVPTAPDSRRYVEPEIVHEPSKSIQPSPSLLGVTPTTTPVLRVCANCGAPMALGEPCRYCGFPPEAD
jgi:hypothetical protein